MNLEADRVDDEIRNAQRQLVEVLDLDRSSLFELSDAGDVMVFTHYWSRPGLPPLPPVMSTAEMFPFLLACIRRGELVCFENVDDLPSDVDRESIRRIGTKSNVTVP